MTAIKNCGRKRKLDPLSERRLTKIVKRDPYITANEAMSLMSYPNPSNVSKWTASRILKRHGLHNRKPAKKPALTLNQRQRRLKFVKKRKYLDWSKVVFSDEKRFCLRGDGPVHECVRVWRRRGQRYPIKLDMWQSLSIQLQSMEPEV